jgi:CRISPR-associated protein Cas2
MWLMVMFDLPVTTREDRKNYRDFHDHLEESGFTRMQFSVYVRPCATEEFTEGQVNRVLSALPPDGEVRILKFTDKQWGRMLLFRGLRRTSVDAPPEQFEFFDDDGLAPSAKSESPEQNQLEKDVPHTHVSHPKNLPKQEPQPRFEFWD